MSVAAIVGAVFAAGVAVALAVVVRTRWLESRTLEKCVALSVLLHAILAIVCVFVGGWSAASWGTRDEGRMTMLVALADDASDEFAMADASEVAQPSDEAPAPEAPAEPAPQSVAEVTVPANASAAAPPDDHVPLLEVPEDELAATAGPASVATRTPAPPEAAPAPTHRVPATYADRMGERRAAAAAARGGSDETERAVHAGVAWLVAAQSADGRWSAAGHGAGVERAVQGHHRQGAGARSDHGVTGLALLALLGAGNTHRDGPHAASVHRGLRFLLDRQRSDGSLAGDAEFFAALYCHGMATIALAECAAMTGDTDLRPPLDRAVAHTLAMQHPHTGGWRYAAGDRGDTSQCGWQVMVLASARAAGLTGFDAAEERARRFLAGVSSGAAGGLASYRHGERPSVAMTAEALFCRLVLGLSPGHPAAGEALSMIAASPPTTSIYNSYTWYYATLASFHAGGPQWERWNAALQATLPRMQRREGGPLDGSWDPDPVWGGHGGRVYATALSTMTLEVYYRHLPMHQRQPRMASAGPVAGP